MEVLFVDLDNKEQKSFIEQFKPPIFVGGCYGHRSNGGNPNCLSRISTS